MSQNEAAKHPRGTTQIGPYLFIEVEYDIVSQWLDPEDNTVCWEDADKNIWYEYLPKRTTTILGLVSQMKVELALDPTPEFHDRWKPIFDELDPDQEYIILRIAQ